MNEYYLQRAKLGESIKEDELGEESAENGKVQDEDVGAMTVEEVDWSDLPKEPATVGKPNG